MNYLNLVYVNQNQLSIERRKQNEKFQYYQDGDFLKDGKQLKRIKALVIPPAWQNVFITHLPNGHLQAIGHDAKQRKQYRYHELWKKVRNQTKFYRMIEFGERLPTIRKQTEKDLDQKGWHRSKVLALVLKLMDETHIRIGNHQYAKRNKTYGLTTLRKRHVAINGNKLRFEFTGKRGKKHKITLRNKKLSQLVSKCEEIPGWELFKFFDSDGEKHHVDSSMVNDYLYEITGADFTAKDFRTWAATLVFFDTLIDLGSTTDSRLNQKNILQAYDAAAAALGNTRNTCRKYYVHPIVPLTYEKGSIEPYFEKADRAESSNLFSASEKAVLELIRAYKPEVLKMIQHED